MFWKKDKIEFVSTLPGVADMFPILPSSKYWPKWIAKSMADYKANMDKTKKVQHIAQCPGIFAMFKTGYVVTSWYDVVISTKQNEPGFSWRVADPDLMENAQMNIIDTHGDQITQHIPKRKGQIQNIVKINTPYHIIAPKGVKFMFMPLPYPDSFDYESTSGILDPAESSELNIQLNWYKEEGEVLIKAGTPLMYILPISEKEYSLVSRDATDKEINWMKKRRYFNSFSFTPIRSKVKTLYERYFQ